MRHYIFLNFAMKRIQEVSFVGLLVRRLFLILVNHALTHGQMVVAQPLHQKTSPPNLLFLNYVQMNVQVFIELINFLIGRKHNSSLMFSK